MRKVDLALASLVVLFAAPRLGLASLRETSWIFRSEVVPGQNMWQPGTHTGYNFPYDYSIPGGMLKGTGISATVQADPGTVSGNVEGNLTVKYEKIIQGANKQTLRLAYNGIGDESRIGTDFGVKLVATPRLKVNLPWPIPDVNVAWDINMFDIGVSARKDFTTGLGQLVTENAHQELAALGVDAIVANAGVKLHLDENIWFTPTSIVGTVTATHMATGTTQTLPVTFTTDGAEQTIDLDLDKTGGWEVSLDDFRVDENAFRQAFGLAVELNVAVPIVRFSTSLFLGAGVTGYGSEFPLAFNNHGYDGDVLTPDNLGSFCFYVESLPEPATLGLLALGGLAVLRRRRA